MILNYEHLRLCSFLFQKLGLGGRLNLIAEQVMKAKLPRKKEKGLVKLREQYSFSSVPDLFSRPRLPLCGLENLIAHRKARKAGDKYPCRSTGSAVQLNVFEAG